MSISFKILCIFVLLTVHSYAAQNINIGKSGMEFYSFLGLDCKHHARNINMEKVCGIYKITNPKGAVYIGQSRNCTHRETCYRNLWCKEQHRLYNSIIKYGWEAHKFEIIHRCAAEELNGLEVYYIDLFKCFNTENGLNLKHGGNSRNLSDETKRKISESAKKRYENKENHPRFGKPLSNELREKLSKRHTGKKMSLEACEKMRRNNLGKKASDATRIKMSFSQTLRQNKKRQNEY